MVWRQTAHNFDLYHSKGLFTIHRVNDFFLIAQLGVGGSLIREEQGNILLDNTYVLDRNINERTSLPINDVKGKNFSKFAEKYAKETKPNVERDLLEGRITSQFLLESHFMSALAVVSCNSQREIYNLQWLVMRNFPEMSNELIFEEEGFVVESVGDALLVKKCEVIRYANVVWNQSINGVCFQHFPVSTLTRGVMFLELSTRRIFNESEIIACQERKEHTFVRDKSGVFWKYTLDKGFRIVKLRYQQDFKDKLTIPKIASYNSKSRHYAAIPPHRTTLLRILASQRGNLRELADLRKQGGGSVLQGIFSGITEVVETMSDTGATIFHSIAKGLTHVANDSVNVVTGVGDELLS